MKRKGGDRCSASIGGVDAGRVKWSGIHRERRGSTAIVVGLPAFAGAAAIASLSPRYFWPGSLAGEGDDDGFAAEGVACLLGGAVAGEAADVDEGEAAAGGVGVDEAR